MYYKELQMNIKEIAGLKRKIFKDQDYMLQDMKSYFG